MSFCFCNSRYDRLNEIKEMRNEYYSAKDVENKGLLQKRLFNMKNVKTVHTASSLCHAVVVVKMYDGYEIRGYDCKNRCDKMEEALKNAMKKVYERNRDKYLARDYS